MIVTSLMAMESGRRSIRGILIKVTGNRELERAMASAWTLRVDFSAGLSKMTNPMVSAATNPMTKKDL